VSQSTDPIIQAFLSSGTVRTLLRNLPLPEETRTLGGCIGSSGAATLAAIHQTLDNRVMVALAPSPNEAAAVKADLDALLGTESSFLYPQRESLPYETSEPHVEVGGLRVEALERSISSPGDDPPGPSGTGSGPHLSGGASAGTGGGR